MKTWKDYVPEKVWLGYVEQGDSYEGQFGIKQDCVSKNDLCPIYEDLSDWEGETNAYYARGYLDDIEKEMCEDGLEKEYKKHKDEIRDLLYDRDESDMLWELISRGEDDFFYSLGMDVPFKPWEDGHVAYNIRRKLKLPNEEKYTKAIQELVDNCYYGGELRIYFSANITDMISRKKFDFRSIEFSGTVAVGIVNSTEGSGYMVDIRMDKLVLPFKRGNLFLDRAVNYSWHEICRGMTYDTKVELSYKGTKGILRESGSLGMMQMDRQYEKTFKEGKCTFGDMNMRRHRDVVYDNSFPAGNRCPHCGTFWID